MGAGAGAGAGSARRGASAGCDGCAVSSAGGAGGAAGACRTGGAVARMTPVGPVARVARMTSVGPVARVARMTPVGPVARVARMAPVGPVARVARMAPVGPVARVARMAPVGPVARVARMTPVGPVARIGLMGLVASSEKRPGDRNHLRRRDWTSAVRNRWSRPYPDPSSRAPRPACAIRSALRGGALGLGRLRPGGHRIGTGAPSQDSRMPHPAGRSTLPWRRQALAA